MTLNQDDVSPSVTVDPTKTHVVKELKHDSPIISCRFDATGKYVFFGSQDYKVWRWEWAGDTKVEFNHNAWVRGIACHSKGETVLTAGYDGRLVWWQANAEKPEPARSVEAHAGWVRDVEISPDGKLVATSGNDHKVKLWSFEDGSLVHELSGHEAHVYNLAFHPDGKSLVSGDLKANLIHWDLEKGEQVRTFKADSLCKYDNTFKADIGGFRGLAFNNDGTRLAGSGITNVTNAFAGVGNPAIVVFDWKSAELKIQHESKGKLRGVAWGVAFHPVGFTIGISGGSGGGFLLFWKPDQKEEFHRLKLKNTARDLDLASDGLHVATGHYDRHVRVSRLAEKAS
jgi:WD40 repeat protein